MNTMARITTSFFFFCLINTNVQAGFLERWFMQEQQSHPGLKTSSIRSGWFSQRLDAEDPNTPMFLQRYYINEEFSLDNNAPVFFYICGEAACEANVLNGAIRDYAKLFHANMVALEHRYYGKSQPFSDLSTENLRFLTTEHALNDLAYFQRKMKNLYHWQGKWIAFGGSYPGSLSAYYRMKYPYLIQGALASSAPVQAKEAFSDYDQHVTKVAGFTCANAIREAVHSIESKMSQPDEWKKIKQTFGAADVINDKDFLYVLADIGASAVQYGMRDEFCADLTQSSDVVRAYADFAYKIYQRFNIRAVDLTPQAAMSENIDDAAKGLGMRQWLYQSCTEYGYWQVAHPNAELSSRSAQIDLEYHRQICKRLFNLERPANTDLINSDFYQPLFNHLTQRIYFTNGSNDPWSTLSLTPENAQQQNPNLSYTMIKGAAHCDDLRIPKKTDSTSLKKARETMIKLLKEWLA